MTSSITGNPGRLVPILDSGNYHTWKTKMEMLLIREGLWSIVCERRLTPSPQANAQRAKWEEDSDKATATIFLYLGDRAERHVHKLRDPVLIWKRLREVYELRGFSARFYLWQKLFTLRHANYHSEGAKSTESYVDSCRSLCEQLRSSGAEVSDEIVASALLKGLDKSYKSFVVMTTQSFRSNGNGGQGEINVEELISQILDENRRHIAIGNTDASLPATFHDSQALATHTMANKQPRYQCDHCYRTGHTKERCWDLHPHLRPKPASAHTSVAFAENPSDDVKLMAL
jgi:hypothetical protein